MEVFVLGGEGPPPAMLSEVPVDAGGWTVLDYRPWGSAIDQVPVADYLIAETFAEYQLLPGGADDFLSILLDRIESRYALTGFANAFRLDFDAFLQSVDLDDAAPGQQPYLDPTGAPVLDLAGVGWYGPAQTWPAELVNHPWIHFWHRLDEALATEAIPELTPQGLGDAAWGALFASGPLIENPAIVTTVATSPQLRVGLRPFDQVGTRRPVGAAGDVGAIERP